MKLRRQQRSLEFRDTKSRRCRVDLDPRTRWSVGSSASIQTIAAVTVALVFIVALTANGQTVPPSPGELVFQVELLQADRVARDAIGRKRILRDSAALAPSRNSMISAPAKRPRFTFWRKMPDSRE